MTKNYLEEKQKKKKGGFGKFVLGWVLSLIFNLALVVGLGFWFYKNGTISGVEKTFGFEVGVISEDAKNLTLENLVGKVVNVATNYNNMSIEEIADGVGLDLGAALTITGEGASKTYAFKGLEITSVIKGKLGEAGNNMQAVIDELSLGEIESMFGMTLPNYEFINSIKTVAIKDLSTATSGIFDSYTLNKLSTEFGVSFNSVDMLTGLLDVPFSQLPSELNNLKVSDVINTAGATGVLKAIKDFNINTLGSQIQTLKIEDLFEESELNSNTILNALKTAQITNLANAVNNLKVSDIYPSSTNKFIQAISTYNVNNLTDAFDSIKISDIINMEKTLNTSYVEGVDPEYKQYQAQGVWAYIDGNMLLKNFGSFSLNVADITLGELQYQGLIDQDLLLESVTLYDEGKEAEIPLADFTLNGFISAVIDALA